MFDFVNRVDAVIWPQRLSSFPAFFFFSLVFEGNAPYLLRDEKQLRWPGAHYPECSTPIIYSCNGVFTDLFIFRLKFPQIQSPWGASLTSLMLCMILM